MAQSTNAQRAAINGGRPMSSADTALWQIPFTAHDADAQMLAQKVLADQRRTSRHKYWDVECLQESLRKNTFQEILDVLQEDEHPDSPLLHKALGEEFARRRCGGIPGLQHCQASVAPSKNTSCNLVNLMHNVLD